MLQYCSRLAVLEYLDPNIRACLARRCSGFSKSFPLKADTLQFFQCGVRINSTVYKVRIVNNGQNREDKAYDVDDQNCLRLVNPVRNDLPNPLTDWNNPEEIVVGSGRYLYNARSGEYFGKSNLVGSFIQLTILSPNMKRVEKLIYRNKTLLDAHKYLIWKLFQNRIVSVGTLEFDFNHFLRLPARMKLFSKHLKLCHCDEPNMNHLINYLRFPVESIKIEDPSMSNHWITSESKLQIVPWYLGLSHPFMGEIPKSHNVNFTNPLNLQKYPREILSILKNLVNHGEKVEQRCSFVVNNGIQYVKMLFDEIKTMPGAKTKHDTSKRRHEFPLQVFIPCLHSDELEVKAYCKANDADGKLTTLHFEIQQVDSAM